MTNQKTFARRLRSNMTVAERKPWQWLRGKQVEGFRFRRQYPLGDYIVDFISLSARLIVEVDGSQHQDQMVHDARRTAWLQAQGFRVLRFWNNEVLEDTESVLNVIRDALLSPPS